MNIKKKIIALLSVTMLTFMVGCSSSESNESNVTNSNGEEVVVTSVQDELFPYEGNAKEQFNKKVVATINDMIEGKATLEDLIQLVRKGPKRTAHESLSEEIINEISDKLKFKAAERAQYLRNIAVARHGLTTTPDDQDGDLNKLKDRENAIEREKKLKGAIKKHNEFKAKKEKVILGSIS